MTSRTYYIVSYMPILNSFAWYEIKSLSDAELQNLCALIGPPHECWLCIFDSEPSSIAFWQAMVSIAKLFFKSSKKKAAQALRNRLNKDGLNIPAFLRSLMSIPLETDREAKLEIFVRDTRISYVTFYVILTLTP